MNIVQHTALFKLNGGKSYGELMPTLWPIDKQNKMHEIAETLFLSLSLSLYIQVKQYQIAVCHSKAYYMYKNITLECNRVNIKSPHTHTSTDASARAYPAPYMWVQRIHWSKDNKRKTEKTKDHLTKKLKQGYYFKMFKILLFFILHTRILTKHWAGKKVQKWRTIPLT